MGTALRGFCDSLTVVSPAPKIGVSPQRQFDLVVLDSQANTGLLAANMLVADGGCLYWEIERRSWKQRIALRQVKNHLVGLERLGFEQIQVSWHRPDFETCLEIIPLDDARALSYVFSRSSGHLIGRIKLAVGRCLASTRILPCLVPCVSITALKKCAVNDHL